MTPTTYTLFGKDKKTSVEQVGSLLAAGFSA